MRKLLLPLLMLLTALLVIQPLSVAAYAPLETGRECSLKVHFAKDDYRFPDLEARIYRVAEAHTDGNYSLIAPFSGFPVSIHGIHSQQEWRDLAATMVAYIVDRQVEPSYTALSDNLGTASFSRLPTGLYLVLGTQAENASGIYTFEDFFVYLPTPAGNNAYQYDMEARPKPGAFVPKTELVVKKLWKDAGASSNRPKSVAVDIFQDQKLYETITLSAENDWSYSWQTVDTHSQWTVAEKDVPDGYTVAIHEDGGNFSITNSIKSSPEAPPQTGDTFPLWFYLTAMWLSGFLLLSFGIWRQRKIA